MKFSSKILALTYLFSLGFAADFANAQSLPPRAPGAGGPIVRRPMTPMNPQRPTGFVGIRSFMRPNRLNMQDGVRMTNMTEQQFNDAIDAVVKTFAPVVRQFGGNLVSEKKWADTTVNAYASQ